VTWLIFLSGVTLLSFVWIELALPRPLLDLKVFRFGSFAASSIYIIGLNVALFAGAFYIPVFLQLVRGLGALQTGLTLMPGALASGLMMPIAGRLYDRVGPIPSVAVGTVILAGATYLMHAMSLQTSSATIAGWMAIRGLGMGMAMMPAMTAGMSVIPTQLVGRAAAISNIIQRVAGSLGIALLTVLLDNGQAQRAAGLSAQYTVGSPHAIALQGLVQSLGGSLTMAATELGGYVQAIAFTRSIDSVFVLLAILSAVSIVPVFFLRKATTAPQGAGRPGPVAE